MESRSEETAPHADVWPARPAASIHAGIQERYNRQQLAPAGGGGQDGSERPWSSGRTSYNISLDLITFYYTFRSKKIVRGAPRTGRHCRCTRTNHQAR